MIKNKAFAALLILCMVISAVPSAFAADVIPAVIKTTPESGAENIGLINTVVDVNFNTEMDEKTVTSSSVVMSPNVIQDIEMLSGKKMRIHMSKLDPAQKYEISFTKGILSAEGKPLSPSKTEFTTTGEFPQYRQIVNGDMEQEDMSMFGVGDGNQPVQVEDGSNKVMKFVAGWDQAPVLQKVYLEPNKIYEARARIKAKETTEVWFSICYVEPGSDEWIHLSAKNTFEPGEWCDMTATFQMPSAIDYTKTRDIRIVVGTQNKEIYIDDWQFYEQGFDIPAPDSGSGGGSSGTANKTVIDKSEDSRRSMLEAFGIYDANEYSDASEQVSREKFSKYLAVMLGCGGMVSEGSAELAADLEGYEGYAQLMLEKDLLKKDENGAYNPYKGITFGEACRALVTALGFKSELESKLPQNAAANLGITKGVNIPSGNVLTFEQLNKLLVNFLDCRSLTADKIVNGQPGYALDSCVLECKMGLTEREGIVEATSVTSLSNYNGIGEGRVKIAGSEYVVYNDVSELLGKNVKFYTKETDGGDAAIFFTDIDKKNDIVLIDARNLTGYTGGAYNYTTGKNSSRKRAVLSSDRYLIYNNRSVSEYTDADMLTKDGSVELIDNNRDGKYEIVKVINYETFVVESVDKANGVITDKYENKTLNLDLAGEIIVYSNGVKGKLDSISADNVLSVLQSKDKHYTVIYRSSNIFSGWANDIRTDDDGYKYIVFYDEVHGKDILSETECVKNYAGINSLDPGESGILYLDAFGRVAAFKKQNGAWEFAYIVKAAMNTDEESICFWLFREDGTINKTDSVDRLRINEKRSKNSDEAYRILCGTDSKIPSQLIQIKCDDDGKIREMLTAKDVWSAGDDGFRRISPTDGRSYTYLSDTFTIGNKYFFTGSTPLFVVSGTDGDLDLYQYRYIPAQYYMLNNKNYSSNELIAYSTTDNDYVASAFILKNSPIQNADILDAYIVGAIQQVFDEESGEVLTKLVCYNARGKKTFYADNKVDLDHVAADNGSTSVKLQKGDIVTFTTRKDGRIYEGRSGTDNSGEMRIVYRCDGNKAYTSILSDLDSRRRTFFGTIAAKIDGGILKVISSDGDSLVELFKTNAFGKMYKFDTSTKKIEEITLNDITGNGTMNFVTVSVWRDYNIMIVF